MGCGSSKKPDFVESPQKNEPAKDNLQQDPEPAIDTTAEAACRPSPLVAPATAAEAAKKIGDDFEFDSTAGRRGSILSLHDPRRRGRTGSVVSVLSGLGEPHIDELATITAEQDAQKYQVPSVNGDSFNSTAGQRGSVLSLHDDRRRTSGGSVVKTPKARGRTGSMASVLSTTSELEIAELNAINGGQDERKELTPTASGDSFGSTHAQRGSVLSLHDPRLRGRVGSVISQVSQMQVDELSAITDQQVAAEVNKAAETTAPAEAAVEGKKPAEGKVFSLAEGKAEVEAEVKAEAAEVKAEATEEGKTEVKAEVTAEATAEATAEGEAEVEAEVKAEAEVKKEAEGTAEVPAEVEKSAPVAE